MRCLLLDDNPEDLALVERVIRRLGHRTTCVPDVESALAALDVGAYDVALVDLGLPGVSGMEALMQMRRRDRGLRLLVVSGFDDRRHVLAAIDAGADGYILKTEVGERLGQALQEIRAGESPLSARVAAVLLRKVAGKLGTGARPALPARPARLADASGEIIHAGQSLPKE